MSEPPTVSIGMPVYNGEALLERSIPSILEQSWRDFELVICDDASRDGTEALCRRFAAEDSRVRYRRNRANLGGSANFNQVFSLARGRYFKWCAQDDVIRPSFLQAAVDVLESDPEVVLCHARTRIVDRNLDTLVRVDPGAYGTDSPQAWRRFAARVRARRCFELYGLIRRESLLGTPLLAPFIGSDRVLLARLALRGRFHILPEDLFLSGHHDAQSTRFGVRPLQRLAWYRPGARATWVLPTWTLFREYARAITEETRDPRTRALCRLALVRALGARWNLARLLLEPLIAIEPRVYDALVRVRDRTGIAVPDVVRAGRRARRRLPQ